MQTPNITDKLNEAALVLRITYQNISFLLPSDLSVDGQIELLKSAAWPLATVLQLPNHGGIRSLEQSFLTAVQPQVAIVQADPTNRLGDPDSDTLSLLGNTPLYRTDHSGTLHFWTDGQTLWAVPSK
jgi:competence protein ComEC